MVDPLNATSADSVGYVVPFRQTDVTGIVDDLRHDTFHEYSE